MSVGLMEARRGSACSRDSVKRPPASMSLCEVKNHIDSGGWKLKELVGGWNNLRKDGKIKEAEKLLIGTILPRYFTNSIDQTSNHDLRMVRRALGRYTKV